MDNGGLPCENDNKDGVSPLHLAVAYQKVETLKVLLQRTKSAGINVQVISFVGTVYNLKKRNLSIICRHSILITLGLFPWREEDPSTRKILVGGATLYWVNMQKFRSVWLPSRERIKDSGGKQIKHHG